MKTDSKHDSGSDSLGYEPITGSPDRGRKARLLRLLAVVLSAAAALAAPMLAEATMVAEWAIGAGDASSDRAVAVAANGTGNVVCGYFYDTIDLGGGTLTSAGDSDLYLAKYDQNGNHVWSMAAGGTGTDLARDVAMDASGNVYFVGYFYSQTLFFGSVPITNHGQEDLFVVKFDSNGVLQWARGYGGNGVDRANAVVVGPQNIIVVGRFEYTIWLGSAGTLVSAGKSDVLGLVLDSSGNEHAAFQAGGPENDIAFGVALDGTGNRVVTGQYAGTANFEGDILSSVGSTDIFLWRRGHWAASFGGTGVDAGLDVKRRNGELLLCGKFSSIGSFGGTEQLVSAGNTDGFVARYALDGTHLWSRRFGGTGFDSADHMAFDDDDRVLVSGEIGEGVADFDWITTTSAGYYDVVVARYLGDGTIDAIARIGGVGSDYQGGVATHGGKAIVAGTYRETISVGGVLLTSAGGLDVFLAQFSGATAGLDADLAPLGADVMALGPAYPNPMRSGTSLSFTIGSVPDGVAQVAIFDVSGRRVRSLERLSAISGTSGVIAWDGRNEAGAPVPAGVYFARLWGHGVEATRRITVVR